MSLDLRGVCTYIQAQAGDGCYNLAARCKISQANLVSYNPQPNFCNSIKVGDYVCCSSGTLPDFSPQPYTNGTCYTHTVQSGDTCAAIATANHIANYTTIETVNGHTWGWAGCSDIQAGQRICLSTGTPPFPAPVPNTVCGPQVPGTQQPSNINSWSMLNPCPLNACCDVWGQCGTTIDFCAIALADTGAPGTAKKGTNGCISNCGLNVINGAHPPANVMRIGYFESWNQNRPCLNMDIRSLQDSNSYYTHLHFGFANVTSNWQVDVSGAQDQFVGLLELAGVKRILSFGGWGFSTSLSTHTIFRTGVQPANRQTFATNVVKFIVDNNLDGVDFDWEYPGAQDIPGIAPDSPDSGANYLEFLKLVRAQLPSSATLSIAAPASYWYLKNFPIANISTVVDYIVYMTYDLHGQWDYGNKFSDPGCPGGNCLRSHVNLTETQTALAMITKAGVLANKIVPGLSLYGRSFQMAQAGCISPDCQYTGPASGATPGRCTGTAGYISNYEIADIIAHHNGKILQNSTDEGDILVYNQTQWVSYLTPASYLARQAWTDGMNFAGTADWAIDLNGTYGTDTSDIGDDGVWGPEDWVVCDYSLTFSSLDDLNTASAAGNLRSDCIGVYTLQVLMDMLNTAYVNYTDVNNGYDDLFGSYVTYLKKLVPEIAANELMFNASTTAGDAYSLNVGFGMNYFSCKFSDGTVLPCSQWNTVSLPTVLTTTAGPTALTLTDENGYLAALAQVGLDPDWVVLGDYSYDRTITTPQAVENFQYAFTGFPVENSSMVVPNPKDIVTKGIGSIPDLQTSMQATLLEMMLGIWANGSVTDPAQAYSAPVFMLLQAVDGMARAKQLGQQEQQQEQQEAADQKNFILLIISAIFLFVPVVGEEIAVAAGLATLARVIAIAGELGNVALGIYDTVQNPSSAIVNILGMLFGVGAITKAARDGAGIAGIAKLRRGMSADEVSSMGALFKANDDTLKNIAKVCKWK